MNNQHKKYLYLVLWILAIVLIGSAIGSLTKSAINTWYSTLNRSELTPPNYVFPMAWTILYVMIAVSGWFIWQQSSLLNLTFIKTLYVMQFILNWCWIPLFFRYHLTGVSLFFLILMDVSVGIVIYSTYTKIRSVFLLMIPYFLWILFATYLNFYIWKYN